MRLHSELRNPIIVNGQNITNTLMDEILLIWGLAGENYSDVFYHGNYSGKKEF